MPRSSLLDDLDRLDAEAWLRHLAPDVVMRFAAEDPVLGRDRCRTSVLSLFDSVRSIEHHVIDRWDHGEATIIEASVDFGLPDGSDVALPMVTIYRTNDTGLIADYRVYVDPRALWG